MNYDRQPTTETRGMLVPDTPPAAMTNAAIRREYARLDREHSAALDRIIAAGYGHVRPSNWRDLVADASVRILLTRNERISARRHALEHEAQHWRGCTRVETLPRGGARIRAVTEDIGP